MSEPAPFSEGTSRGVVLKYVLTAIAVIYVGVSLFLLFDMRGRVEALENKEKSAELAQRTLQEKLHLTNEQMAKSMEALGSKVGLTQDEISRRTAELRRQQLASEQRLSQEQQKTQQSIGQVSGEVAGVKTELGGAKTDIASTRSDLDATKSKLEKAIGDLGVQSGLVARNHDELEILKHKGDRNYIEFTLKKNQRTPVGTISLQLKKADMKKSRFTLNVIADDRTIEKKDRTMNEPLQFYTGRDRSLYEVVVYTVGKNEVTGYLTSPKNQ